jgi:type II secretory pathway component PulJ
MRSLNPRGVTLMEVIVFGALSAVILLGIAQWLNRPALLGRLAQVADDQRDAQRAIDRLVSDIKEADPTTVNWSVAVSTAPLVLAKPQFDAQRQEYQAPHVIVYYFEPAAGGLGALMRLDGEHAEKVLSPIEAPTAEQPLFQKDPHLPLVTVSVQYRPVGRRPLRLVRRVSLTS